MQVRSSVELPWGEVSEDDLAILSLVERRVLWLTTYLLHYINKVWPSPDDVKVGGHQASSVSLVSILTALYGVVLQPQDHIALKPHAAPVFHVLHYVLGRLSLDELRTPEDIWRTGSLPQ